MSPLLILLISPAREPRCVCAHPKILSAVSRRENIGRAGGARLAGLRRSPTTRMACTVFCLMWLLYVRSCVYGACTRGSSQPPQDRCVWSQSA